MNKGYENFVVKILETDDKEEYLFQEVPFPFPEDGKVEFEKETYNSFKIDKDVLEKVRYSLSDANNEELKSFEDIKLTKEKIIQKLKNTGFSQDKIDLILEKSRTSFNKKDFWNEINSKIGPITSNGIPQAAKLAKAGKALWLLFPVEFKDRFLKELKRCKEKGPVLRLRLLIEPFSLRKLPWESLYIEKNKPEYLGLDEYASIVHLSSSELSTAKLAPLEDFKVLLVISNKGIPAPDVVEMKQVYDTLKNLEEFTPEIEILEDPNPDELEGELKKGYHIVHLLCHGDFIGGDPIKSSYIQLKDRDLTAEDFSEMVLQTEKTRLVFLAACKTGTGFGYGLSEAGIPAVAVMRYKISKDRAVEGFKEFYEAIASKYSLDQAVYKMRRKIESLRLVNSSEEECFTPMFFLSSCDSFLL